MTRRGLGCTSEGHISQRTACFEDLVRPLAGGALHANARLTRPYREIADPDASSAHSDSSTRQGTRRQQLVLERPLHLSSAYPCCRCCHRDRRCSDGWPARMQLISWSVTCRLFCALPFQARSELFTDSQAAPTTSPFRSISRLPTSSCRCAVVPRRRCSPTPPEHCTCCLSPATQSHQRPI